jgi:nucleoside 2-deoxyribosyltransferase
MSQMRLVYIAGPFRGPTPWDVECNIRRAEELALQVNQLGCFAMVPHTMTRFFDKQCTDQHWLDGTLEMMRRCDGVIFAADWQRSSGARAEHDEALRLGMPLFYAIDDLHRWREARA